MICTAGIPGDCCDCTYVCWSSFDLVSSHMNEEDHKQETNTYCENIKIKLIN